MISSGDIWLPKDYDYHEKKAITLRSTSKECWKLASEIRRTRITDYMKSGTLFSEEYRKNIVAKYWPSVYPLILKMDLES